MEGEIRLTKPTSWWELQRFIERLTEGGTVVEEITEIVIKVSR